MEIAWRSLINTEQSTTHLLQNKVQFSVAAKPTGGHPEMSPDIKDSQELCVCGMHLIDRQEPQTHCGLLRSAHFQQAYLNATFTQQSPRLAIIAFSGHRRDVWSISARLGFQWVRSVSGQREQPSRPADGELLRRDSSCLLLALRCGAHFWHLCACHVAKFNPRSLCFLAVSLSVAASCFGRMWAAQRSALHRPHRYSERAAVTLVRRWDRRVKELLLPLRLSEILLSTSA